ncbi:hypothetical protein [Sandaracinus amylolyticus]|uniref:Lipoprotein n=1 Tax=Sandaracinus amylolyticus TaxID=927083 RepID=A0A0F6YNJ2_9BACT|nr:hypothetical protein [Sandaracinus amylolyticus]AKF11541.1 hypothetical protein DB32_008690 [Sandaracinus amylolyticus]
MKTSIPMLVLAGALSLVGCERDMDTAEPTGAQPGETRGRAAGEPAKTGDTTLSPEQTAPDTVAPGSTGALGEDDEP